MHIVTFKAKPKMIFGIILAITGIIVVLLTFVGNHNGASTTMATGINCAKAEDRAKYIKSFGWEFTKETSKDIVVPPEFDDVYSQYNEIQKKQGFDLENYKGKNATVYTYSISNYKEADVLTANLLVCDGKLIGSDLCNPDVDNGFLVPLQKNNNGTIGQNSSTTT